MAPTQDFSFAEQVRRPAAPTRSPGTRDRDTISLAGSDSGTASGLGGDDVLSGGTGAGSYALDGGSGNDLLQARGGHSTLNGGKGNDSFSAANGQVDQINGGAGTDTAHADPFDLLRSIETLT